MLETSEILHVYIQKSFLSDHSKPIAALAAILCRNRTFGILCCFFFTPQSHRSVVAAYAEHSINTGRKLCNGTTHVLPTLLCLARALDAFVNNLYVGVGGSINY